jgi:hypothetical protein
MTVPTILKPADMHADNIIHAIFDELLEEHKKAYKVVTKKRQKELNLLRKQREDEFSRAS